MRKRKMQSRIISRSDGARIIQDIFKMRSRVSYDERLKLADMSYQCLDEMKIRPSRDRYIDLVDMTNALACLIKMTGTRKGIREHRCQNILAFLFEAGHEDVTLKINRLHDKLEVAEQRFHNAGSWALDAETFGLLEQVITMYQEACSVTPLKMLYMILQRLDGTHTVTQNEMLFLHIRLEDRYAEKEREWEENHIPVLNDVSMSEAV